MATIKAYSDLEQSRKLAEILPLESADMEYLAIKEDGKLVGSVPFVKDDSEVEDSAYDYTYDRIACWSLAALLDIFPKDEYKYVVLCFGGYQGDEYILEWCCSYEQQEPFIIKTCYADNPVDACYEMIIKLHELNLL